MTSLSETASVTSSDHFEFLRVLCVVVQGSALTFSQKHVLTSRKISLNYNLILQYSWVVYSD